MLLRLPLVILLLLGSALAASAQESTAPADPRLAAADSVREVMFAAFGAGDYARAAELGREDVAMREAVLGTDHLEVAVSLNFLGNALSSAGQPELAREALARALAIRETVLGPEHLDVAQGLNNLAVAMIRLRDFAGARPLQERALEIREAALGPDHADVAVSLQNLGYVHYQLGDIALGRSMYERAIATMERVDGPKHPRVALVRNNLANLLTTAGDYRGAAEELERALAIREAVLPPDHPDLARTLNDLALARVNLGELDVARPLYDRSLAITEGREGPDHPSVAIGLNNIAQLLFQQADYAEARALWERALVIIEAARGPDHLDVALILNNLGLALHRASEYGAARPYLERAIRIREAILGPSHALVAASVGNLAHLIASSGDNAAARPLYERALAVREAALGPEHPEVALALNNLALLMDEEGETEAAVALHRRALAIREAALGEEHAQVAQSLANLAGTYGRLGDEREGLRLMERAARIFAAAVGADHPDHATAVNNVAQTHMRLGELEAARPLHETALAIREAAYGPDHPEVAHSLMNLGNLLSVPEMGGDAAAMPLLLRAGRIRDEYARDVLTVLAAAEQQKFVAGALADQTSALLSVAGGGDVTDAYALLGGWKGLLVEGLRRQNAFRVLADDPALAADVQRLGTLRGDLARHHQQAGQMPAERWTAAYDSLTSEKERLERVLARSLPAGAVADPWRERGLAGLRAALPREAAFVDVYRYDRVRPGSEAEPRYGAIVTRSGREPAFADLGAAVLVDSVVARWRAAVERQDAAGGEAAAMHLAIWAPLAAHIPAEITRIWVSPDAQLARLPWTLLAATATSAGDGAAPLVAEVSSPRALLRMLEDDRRFAGASPAGTGPDDGILLVGGVEFGTDSGSASRGGWGPLPGTEEEVAELARLAEARGVSARIMTGESPTPAAVTSALGTARYAHLATHGFFFAEAGTGATAGSRGFGIAMPASGAASGALSRNPLVESGLALAGANTGAGGNLTAEELVGLDLSDLALIVLSACDTGRGAEVTGQGVLGLRASLEAAGAGAVLMSLWKVPDESTSLLMQHFYRALWEDGSSPALALRSAQDAVRADPRFAAPVHWAAWVLAGRAW